MSRHTKEKRKKQKQKLEAEIKEERKVFDVFGLLKGWNIDTKPNMAKFLKEHVKYIRGNPVTKPEFYPAFELPVNKYFVKFLDDHEFIINLGRRDKIEFWFCYGINNEEMTPSELKLAKEFFAKLFELGFLPNEDERGRSIADRIRGSEPRGAGSIPAGPTSENQFNNGAVSEMEYERDLKSRAQDASRD